MRRTLLRNARRYKEALENRNAELARRKTELERLQAQIVQTEKMASLGQLAARVAHELNNPAGFIYSNIALLKDYIKRLERCLTAFDEVALPPAAAERIREIKTEIDYDDILTDLDSILSDCHIGAERIRDIVQNLRLFSRLDEAELKPVDLNEGIEATLRLLSMYYKSGRIRLLRDYGELPQVNCYASQLNQVWMNLLVNAAQAIGEAEGEVRIKTRCVGENVIVSVSDTGAGIEPEHLKNVFDPSLPLNRWAKALGWVSRSRTALSSVMAAPSWSTARARRERPSRSRYPSMQNRSRLTFQKPARKRGRSYLLNGDSTMKYKIMIVDDESVNLRTLDRLFRRDHQVLLAQSGEEALMKRLVEISCFRMRIKFR